MRHGEYVSGWKFDWQEARQYVDRMYAAGRDIAAAHGADPGCVSCPACGELHWREFEVFRCARCGAEVAIGTRPKVYTLRNGETFTSMEQHVTAGPPVKPEMVRPRYHDGLRVRWRPQQAEWRGTPNHGDWPAGKVPPGTLGTVRPDPTVPFTADVGWRVDWDGITPKAGYVFGLLGPWVDDDLEVVARVSVAEERTEP